MKNVLIVDDEQQTIEVFQAALSSLGYQVVVADNGKNALERIKNQKFDIIILDQMMPDMSGNDVIQILKQDEATKNIPVVILTNYGEVGLVKDAIAAGAADYILKYQMTPTDFADKIKGLIGE